MNDVLAHVMFAISDIDLLAADTVMVAFRRRCRAQRCQIGTGLGFGKIHGASPFTGIQPWQIKRLLRIATNHLERVNGPLCQKLA